MSPNPEPVFGIATLDQIAGMTGKQHLQAIIDGALPAPPIARTMSFRMVEVGDGEVLFEATPGPDLLNPLGGVHGGWALTLIDTVTGCAAHSTLPAGVGFASIETKANFSRPIKADTGLVRAEGRVISKGRTIISAEGKIIDADGRVLAHGTSTVMVLAR
ncbi:PaaI family thioesterase [Rhizobium oryziradicis]|uniref:Phenylacetic acid degradation protein n=1 Tax=Rhizobium oryziradicis TaxID=1867956 RepID=A0A1Q8ZYC7_9HYPH|nr:PaaI family thioesterase [Rhizobium oryziradicis]OLP47047.1 phenylacetic acid degradation protein [Rhizobium oryziradicis]